MTSVESRVSAFLASGLLLLSACGPAAQPAPPTSAPAAKPTEAPKPAAATAPAATTAPAAAKPTEAPKPGATTAPAAKPAAGSPGGRVIIGTFSDVKTFNPILTSDTISDYMSRRIYESLVYFNADTGEPIPQLAEKWEISSDSKTYTFTLRDAKWSDGTPITGDDFKFTAMAVMRSKTTPRRNEFQDIVGAKEFADGTSPDITGITVNGKTITVNLTTPSCVGLSLFGQRAILPKAEFGKYIDGADTSKNLDESAESRGPKLASGPYLFKDWVPNDRVTLSRNDNYWRSKPLLDEVVNKVVPDQTALAAALKTGEIDISNVVNAKDYEDLRRVETLDVKSYPVPSYTYIGWNLLRGGKEFLRSKNVRQAMAYGLNVQQVVDRVYFGQGVAQFSHHPSISWAAPEGLNSYKFDANKAKQLLEQDGWKAGSDGVVAKDGQRLSFEIVTNSGNQAREVLLQVATEQYKQIGIEINPRTESFEALVDRLQKSVDPTYGADGGHDFDAVIIGWSLDVDPDPYSIWHSSQTGTGKFNFVGYRSPTLDKAIEDGRSGACDQASRKKAYDAFNKELNEEQPYNFGLAPNAILAASKRIQGLKQGAWPNQYNGYLYNINEWSLK
jgi:peptide/nickel transport system substrate-binding protein